jgi:adenylate cyclase class 2
MAEVQNRELELRAFEVDGKHLQDLLVQLGATSLGHFEFRRAVLDINPPNPDKWIRVRTDGSNTTLAVKERISKEFDGTGEEEVEVADFDATLRVLKSMGNYTPRSIQESRRDAYLLDGVEVSIDRWPHIAEIAEFEGPDEALVRDIAGRLGVAERLTADTVEEYYLNTLNMDVKNTAYLTFE